MTKVNLRLSAPTSSMTSIGSTELPRDLLIFRPSPSLSSPCMNTVLNGTSFINSRPIKTMRATQKKMMS